MAKPSSNQNDHSRIENRSLKSRQFKGIRMRKWGKWVSEIRMPNSRDRIWLGSYDTPEKAARAFDFAVYCLRGSEADFNFPYSLPDIPEASTLSPQQIQDAAAKFAAEEIWLPSERNIPYPSSLTPLQIQTAAAKFTGKEIWLPSEDNAVDIPTPLLHVRRKFKPPQPNSPQENSRCLPKITQCPLTTVRTVNLGLKAKRFQ